MAVLKHIASKNSDYDASLEYLLFEHDEKTGNLILDEDGRKIQRKELYLDGINCEPFSFAADCYETNRLFNKNQRYDELKTHHYILSFDPRDKTDHGLTGSKAQALGIEFAKKCFPGHQTIVCTHADGSNQSGNIHVHIILNSLRKHDVPENPLAFKVCDTKAGYKHNVTAPYFKAVLKEVMELCNREGLYQIDLLSPAKEKITDREYRAVQTGQTKLTSLNEKIISDGLKPKNTKFQSQKQYIRDAVLDCINLSTSLEQFKSLIYAKYHISIKESRGRFSYLHPDRNKYISDRALGSMFTKQEIEMNLEKNRIVSDQSIQASSFETLKLLSEETSLTENDITYILFMKSDLQLVTDLQKHLQAQGNSKYIRKAKIINLQRQARTVAFVQENRFDSLDDIEKVRKQYVQSLSNSQQSLQDINRKLNSIKIQIHYLGGYLSSKGTYQQLLQSKEKRQYYQNHSTEIEKYRACKKELQAFIHNGRFPSMKDLKARESTLEEDDKKTRDSISHYEHAIAQIDTVIQNIQNILDSSSLDITMHSSQDL